jgi:hypothetical protein
VQHHGADYNGIMVEHLLLGLKCGIGDEVSSNDMGTFQTQQGMGSGGTLVWYGLASGGGDRPALAL